MAITVSDIIALVNKRGRGDPPSALADVFVNPLVSVLNFLGVSIELANISQSVDDIINTLQNSDTLLAIANGTGETVEAIQSLLRQALESIGSNFGIERRAATGSRGNVILMTTTAPTTNIQVAAGRRMYSSSLKQEYRVTETIIITLGSMSWSDTYNAFIYPVPVESVGTGVNTVAAVNQVTTIKDGIAGITGVSNDQPIVGGRDQESDENLGDRIKTALSANNIGTRVGYREMVLANDEVRDSTVVGAGEPLMTRDLGDGGAVDIYVTDPIPLYVTSEPTTATNVGGTSGNVFTPSRQPIIDDVTTISVTGFAPDLSKTTITKDTSVVAGSTTARDKISFFDALSVPMPIPIGTASVTYQTNDLISRIQLYVDDESRKILGSDVMVKEAIPTEVDVQFRLYYLSGFTPSVVKADVENAVTQFISALIIGKSLDQSDVIRVITNVEGVDRIDIPFIKFDKSTSSSTVWPSIITAQANEVLRPGTIEAIL